MNGSPPKTSELEKIRTGKMAWPLEPRRKQGLVCQPPAIRWLLRRPAARFLPAAGLHGEAWLNQDPDCRTGQGEPENFQGGNGSPGFQIFLNTKICPI